MNNKYKENKMRKILTVLVILIGTVAQIFGDEADFTLGGTVVVQSHGDLVFGVYDKDGYEQMKPVKRICIKYDGSDAEKRSVPFLLQNIKPGQYVIACFQDENGNGKLDIGLFGPKEPWGVFNMKKKPIFGKPSYDDVVIKVSSNIKNLAFSVE